MDLSLSIVVSEGGQVLHVDLGPSTTVGRKNFNRLQIKEPYVSSRHAVITRDASGGYTIEDLNSKNGTFLNGQPVHGPAPLRAGDVIQFGLATCKVIPSPAKAAQTSPAPIDWKVADLASISAGGFPKPVAWKFSQGYRPGFRSALTPEMYRKKKKIGKKPKTRRARKLRKSRAMARLA